MFAAFIALLILLASVGLTWLFFLLLDD